MIDVDGSHRDRRTVVGYAGNDFAIGGRFGCDLHTNVRLAFVIEHNQLVVVFGVGISIAQPHGEVGGIAAAQTVGGNTAGQRSYERKLHGFLGAKGAAGEREQQ